MQQYCPLLTLLLHCFCHAILLFLGTPFCREDDKTLGYQRTGQKKYCENEQSFKKKKKKSSSLSSVRSVQVCSKMLKVLSSCRQGAENTAGFFNQSAGLTCVRHRGGLTACCGSAGISLTGV